METPPFTPPIICERSCASLDKERQKITLYQHQLILRACRRRAAAVARHSRAQSGERSCSSSASSHSSSPNRHLGRLCAASPTSSIRCGLHSTQPLSIASSHRHEKARPNDKQLV